MAAQFGKHNVAGYLWRRAMKALLAGIAFAIGMILATHASAALNNSQCPNGTWKNGHYVCGDMSSNS
jgi:hypothetical protein